MVPRVGQCLSTAAAERWTAEGNTISPFNREPIFGFDVALNQIDLLKEVAQAYQAPRKPAEARESWRWRRMPLIWLRKRPRRAQRPPPTRNCWRGRARLRVSVRVPMQAVRSPLEKFDTWCSSTPCFSRHWFFLAHGLCPEAVG